MYLILEGTDVGIWDVMGQAETNHSTTAWAMYSDTTIEDPKVDNSQMAYLIELTLPYDDASHYIRFGGARVHYYYSAVYLPTVSK